MKLGRIARLASISLRMTNTDHCTIVASAPNCSEAATRSVCPRAPRLALIAASETKAARAHHCVIDSGPCALHPRAAGAAPLRRFAAGAASSGQAAMFADCHPKVGGRRQTLVEVQDAEI